MTTIIEKAPRPLARLPDDDNLLAVARRVNWYKEPHDAISDTADFLAHLMTYGRPEDVAVIQRYLTIEDFRAALDEAPPGTMDVRSWNYWNIVTGRVPVPPRPERHCT